MTLRAMLTAPGFFSVGCSDAPAVDHFDHIGYLSHMIIGFPRDNIEGYRAGSCLLPADQPRGHLLMTHGTSDHGATFSGTMKMIDVFIKLAVR